MLSNIINRYLYFILTIGIIVSCEKDAISNEVETSLYEIEHLSAPSHYNGVPIYTVDMSAKRRTEMNSQYSISDNSRFVTVSDEVIRNGYNAVLKINFDNISPENFGTGNYIRFATSIFEGLSDGTPAPVELLDNVNGISFRAVSFNVPIQLEVEAWDVNNILIATKNFLIEKDLMRQYEFDFSAQNLKIVVFNINAEDQNPSEFSDGALGIDDIYLMNGDIEPFTPPTDDTEFLEWLKEASMRYFVWKYKDIDGVRGVVLEASSETNKVSLSGLGYAYAVFIIAEQEGLLTATESRKKILSLLKWQQAQNWFDGSGGWHGIPFHYFNADGSALWPDVSTIDWAMCAAGIRVVRQKYTNDSEIVNIATELLGRAKWEDALDTTTTNDDCHNCYGRIAMGFDGNTGVMNPYRWGWSFSEETELVYLEALASGRVSEDILDLLIRDQKSGFYPSWFGAGFTYNWVQLWTGVQEPYAASSAMAYQYDKSTCQTKFGRPLMGLTACSTINNIDSNGFVEWTQYISNQGGSVSGAFPSGVIQISPAPYGAALALPFQKEMAITALREYVKIGYYHPLLGLPDNIRITDLPDGLEEGIPNWDPFDINIGPIAMAIEQTQQNTIGTLYKQDADISASLIQLINSINN